jgi:hypothetical protein
MQSLQQNSNTNCALLGELPSQAILCSLGKSLIASFICVIICSYTFVSFSVTGMPSCCLRLLAGSQAGGRGMRGVCV